MIELDCREAANAHAAVRMRPAVILRGLRSISVCINVKQCSNTRAAQKLVHPLPSAWHQLGGLRNIIHGEAHE